MSNNGGLFESNNESTASEASPSANNAPVNEAPPSANNAPVNESPSATNENSTNENSANENSANESVSASVQASVASPLIHVSDQPLNGEGARRLSQFLIHKYFSTCSSPGPI